MKALGKYAGFQVLFFLQPEIILEDPNVLSSQDFEIQRLTEGFYQSDPACADPDHIASARKIRLLLPRLFATHNLAEFYDVAEIGGTRHRTNQLYIDYCHLTPTGSRAVAERMFPVVLPLTLNDQKNSMKVPSAFQ